VNIPTWKQISKALLKVGAAENIWDLQRKIGVSPMTIAAGLKCNSVPTHLSLAKVKAFINRLSVVQRAELPARIRDIGNLTTKVSMPVVRKPKVVEAAAIKTTVKEKTPLKVTVKQTMTTGQLLHTLGAAFIELAKDFS
jgi:hypothetical protein